MHLRVTDSGSKSWLFRFTHAKRAREMGLGSSRRCRWQRLGWPLKNAVRALQRM
ncbi:Arm DNA-binding domain-containing protein [Hyphomicrobium nitrativorans]|uniref:Arm DNA-binding domain-containing protein n=1 Tax=Hyphomicrobium nitrativorans TaxID=1427356 RepID=UPI003CC75F73